MTAIDRPPSAAAKRARQQFEAGDTVKAEETLQAWVEETRRRQGPTSPEHAEAQNELGLLLYELGEQERAAAAFRAACADPPPTEDQALRDWLSYTMNLGAVLEESGDLAGAEAVLRRGLAGRLGFYGRGHPGYAFGLEPLAIVLLAQGRHVEALQALEETVDIFWKSGHERVAGAIALRAEALAATGSARAPFAALAELPDALVEQISFRARSRLGRTDPRLSRKVLAELIPFLSERLGEDSRAVLNVLAHWANMERDLEEEGDLSARLSCIRKTIEIADRYGLPGDAVVALQGLALAQSDSGDDAGAWATYQDALARASRLKDPQLHANVLRNAGLFRAEQKQVDEARALLQEAMGKARACADTTLLGRAEIALGIFLQHQGELGEAKRLLAAAVERLEPGDPDGLCGRSHLAAIERDLPCGCGDMARTVNQEFQRFMLERLPADLVERFEVEWVDGDWRPSVHLRRKPERAELEHLHRVFEHARRQFRARMLAKG